MAPNTPSQTYANHASTCRVITRAVRRPRADAHRPVRQPLQLVGDHQRLYSASLIVVLTAATVVVAFYARVFALKAQDRAIRAEEQLRHFVLTGTLLDPRLSMRQVIGLRFAPDEEFVVLARRAAEEGLGEDAIKRAVKSWRARHLPGLARPDQDPRRPVVCVR